MRQSVGKLGRNGQLFGIRRVRLVSARRGLIRRTVAGLEYRSNRRWKRVAFAGIGLVSLVVIAGCTPSVSGAAGVFFSDTGNIHGVVQTCHGSVTSFGMKQGDNEIVWWGFDGPTEDFADVDLGAPSDLLGEPGSGANVTFLGGTPGKANATASLQISEEELDQLSSREVIYATLGEDGDIVKRTASNVAEFRQQACSAF